MTPTPIPCPQVTHLDAEAVTLAEARAAHDHLSPWPLAQAWRDAPEPGFRPASVRIGWHDGGLSVFADLEDADPWTRATASGQRFWELGDTFEMFVRPDAAATYVECHVTPTNLRLQLRFPADGPSALGPDPFVRALIPGDGFTSRTWRRESGDGWIVLAVLPAALVGLPQSAWAGSGWHCSFSRYDYTQGTPAPVLSSTSPHPVPAFHRQQDWSRVRLVP